MDDYADLVDNGLFEKFSETYIVDEIDTDKHDNYCPDCNIPMNLSGIEYCCSGCGQVHQILTGAHGDVDHGDATSGNIRISTGINKGRFYNMSGDYTKTQKKCITNQLLQNQTLYSGNKFPFNVLHAAATQYNNIQKFITEDNIDDNGIVCGQKKFVRRGNIKDEVLAGLIYFECIREKLVRKKKDIALFMKLPTHGFSQGEDILRNLHAYGKIDIPVDEEPIEGFVDRYLDELNLDNPNYSKFIIDLVNKSEENKIGMSSQLSSKVVSALWIINTQCKLGITAERIEKACDNTKKNTFIKFVKIVFANIGTFSPIFTRYNVPICKK